MKIKILVDKKEKKIFVDDPSTIAILENGFYGKREGKLLILSPTEALYLIDIRNAVCFDSSSNNEISFNELVNLFYEKKQLAKYFGYCGWRERGLILRDLKFENLKVYKKSPSIKYEGKKTIFKPLNCSLYFYKDDLLSILEDKEKAQKLYSEHWFGQLGVYKSEHKGLITKFDIFETIFLTKHCKLKIKNCSLEEVLATAKKKYKDFEKIYKVYEDWRLNGFILKTGFKFGTHFRIYFPKNQNNNFEHSKHVLEVFSRKNKQVIYKWARAIRLAHSVKKTFVLAIDGQKKEISTKEKPFLADFVLYSRKKDGISKPLKDDPSYLMLCLSEYNLLSGEYLAQAIEECKSFGLGLILAIADRESSVTFYLVNRIDIPQSNYEYYQLEWFLP